MRKTSVFVALILLALMVSSQWASNSISAKSDGFAEIAPQRRELPDLNEFAQLKSLFEKDGGKVRLIALLSPS